MVEKKFWVGDVPSVSDFGGNITDEFIDGATRQGPWGLMTPAEFVIHGRGDLGTGRGQRYKKQSDGKWLKVEG
jgi:hypothetical protein